MKGESRFTRRFKANRGWCKPDTWGFIEVPPGVACWIFPSNPW